MSIGTVKSSDGPNGYGPFAPDDGSRGVFVQAAVLERAGLGGVKAI